MKTPRQPVIRPMTFLFWSWSEGTKHGAWMKRYASASQYWCALGLFAICLSSKSSVFTVHFFSKWQFFIISCFNWCFLRNVEQLVNLFSLSYLSSSDWWQNWWESNWFDITPKIALFTSMTEFGGHRSFTWRFDNAYYLQSVVAPPIFPIVKRISGNDFHPLRPIPLPYVMYSGKQQSVMNMYILHKDCRIPK